MSQNENLNQVTSLQLILASCPLEMPPGVFLSKRLHIGTWTTYGPRASPSEDKANSAGRCRKISPKGHVGREGSEVLPHLWVTTYYLLFRFSHEPPSSSFFPTLISSGRNSASAMKGRAGIISTSLEVVKLLWALYLLFFFFSLLCPPFLHQLDSGRLLFIWCPLLPSTRTYNRFLSLSWIYLLTDHLGSSHVFNFLTSLNSFGLVGQVSLISTNLTDTTWKLKYFKELSFRSLLRSWKIW